MPLCGGCHGKVHGLDFTHHRQLTKAALDVKKARGERVGQIPYGYRLAADGLHLEPDPSEQRTIARAKALRDAGLTVRRIAEGLSREGFRNRAGHPLAFQAVGVFLRPILAAQ